MFRDPIATDDITDPWGPGEPSISPFTLERVSDLVAASGLHVPENVLGAIVAAIRAGKHVILTGPPGTGKTTLAKLVADAAEEALLCSGVLAATATSDWTVADTVGAGHETANGPTFRPGVVTESIETGRWLLIDELNRADIDRAFGELFTVLAGQAVVLPHRRNEFAPLLSLVPYGGDVPPNTAPICIPKPWRIIATMNTSDRGLLFTLSRALMRRFAFVNVSAPDERTYRDLLDGPGGIVKRLLPLRELQDLGPAIFLDAADYAAVRQEDGASESEVLLEAFIAYVLPQLDPVDEEGSAQLLSVLDAALDPDEREAARALLTEYSVLAA